MSFLQSWIVWALPLALIPIVIHLIHKRRHRVVEWGAMMFLLDGAKLSRGRQRLREILLLAMRTLAILGLIVGIGRPIAGGWVSQLGGSALGSVVLILDRSASMAERPANRADSKLTFGLRGLEKALEVASPSELVVIDATRPTETLDVDALDDLIVLGLDKPTHATADLPSSFETAVRYLEESSAGRAEVWVLSDSQASDWKVDDGRWSALESAMNSLPAGARVRLSLMPSQSPANLSVRVPRARRVVTDGLAELVLDVVVKRASAEEGSASVVPIAVDVGGASTAVEIEFAGLEARLQGLRVPLDQSLESGFGFVQVTADQRPSDDRFWFVFGDTPVLETLIVTERSDVQRVASIAATLPMDPSVELISREVKIDEVESPESLGLAGCAAVLWQAPLPADKDIAAALDDFVSEGGVVVFMPPDLPTETAYRGVRWDAWIDEPEGALPASWRAEDDLIANGDDGTPLPVGETEIYRWCRQELAKEDESEALAHQTLASLGDAKRLLTRAVTPEGGGVYFLGTLPAAEASNLATQGVVFVALVQRAISLAAESRSSDAHREVDPAATWMADTWMLANEIEGDATLAEAASFAGVYTDGDGFVATNRPSVEDESKLLPSAAIEEIFGTVEVAVEVTETQTTVATASAASGLLEEVWRIFIVLALIGLIAEALLCVTEGDAPPLEDDGVAQGGAA